MDNKILGGITELVDTAYDHTTHENTNDKGEAYITGAGIDGDINITAEGGQDIIAEIVAQFEGIK